MEYELYLMHWGIKGQRWGIRKYQNADGTLTAAGKARYAPRHKPSEARKKARYEAERTALLEKGRATDLLKNRKKYNFTDAELKKASERIATKIEVDRKLKELSEKELDKGKSWVDKAVDTATTWKDRVEKGINVWNVVAKIHNSFVDEDDAWQKIGEKSVKEAARERAEKKAKEAQEKAEKEAKEKKEAELNKMVADAAVSKDLNYDDLKKYASAYDKKELEKAIDILDAKKKNEAADKANKEAKEKADKEAKDSEDAAKQKMVADAVFNKRVNMGYDELKKYASVYNKAELERRIAGLEARKRADQEKAEKEAKEAKVKADREAREAKEKAAKAEEKRKLKEEKITKLTGLMKQARATSSNIDDERVRKFFEESGLSWEDYEFASNEAGKKRR